MAQRIHNHYHNCSHRAVIHMLTFESVGNDTYHVIIIATFHLLVLILVNVSSQWMLLKRRLTC